MVDPTQTTALTQHLPYELDMLEETFVRLNSDKFSDQRKDVITKNAWIEAFWTHASNLVEFLNQPPGNGMSGTVSARDFTEKFYPDTNMKVLDQKINAQVSHLTYERKMPLPNEKLGEYDMLRMKQTIDREIKRFEASMKPEYKALWRPRTPSEWIAVSAELLATNETSTFKVISSEYLPFRNS
jgi:hypothetical protein